LSSCTAARAAIPTYSDPAKPIAVNVGQQFVIYLPYNPDTGYTWKEQYDKSKLELVEGLCALCTVGDIQFLQGQGYDLGSYLNTPISAQFSQFKALTKGQTTITMVYTNSLNGQPAQTQTFTVNVQ
jgi:predicted secreted protein